MEVFFLLLLVILLISALASGFPVAFALPGSAIITIGLAALSGYLKEAVLKRPTLRLHTPRAWQHSSAIVSFEVEGHDAGQVSKALREDSQIHVRVVDHYNAIRISTAFFNSQADVDALMSALDEIVNAT